MSLRNRTLISIGITLLVTAILVYALSTSILMRNAFALEEENILRSMRRANSALNHEIADLHTLSVGWSSWDDAYQFVETPSPKYVRTNITTSTLANLETHFMLYINTHGKLVAGKVVNTETRHDEPIPGGLLPALIRQRILPPSGIIERPKAGIAVINGTPLILSIRPILRTNGSGPAHGMFVAARRFDAREVRNIAGVVQESVEVLPLGELKRPYLAEAIAELQSEGSAIVRTKSSGQIAAYSYIKDINGNPIFLMRARHPRFIYQHAASGARDLFLWLLIVGLALTLVTLMLLEYGVLGRVEDFSRTVSLIQRNRDLAIRIPERGNDELTSLAQIINQMLDALDLSHRKLREGEARLSTILRTLPAGVLLIEPETLRIIEANAAAAKMLGMPKKALRGACCQGLICSHPNEPCPLSDPQVQIASNECSLIKSTGERFSILKTVIPVELDGRRIYLESFMDITRQKHYEEVLSRTNDELEARVHERTTELARMNQELEKRIEEHERAKSQLLIQASAVNAASDQIVITDASGTIEFVNPAFVRETGISYSEAIGRNPRMLNSGKHPREFFSEMWSTILSGRIWKGIVTNRRKDGSLATDDMTIAPVHNEQGIIEHFVAIKRNITEKSEYEARLDHMRHHDMLTGLPNRLLLNDRLEQQVAHARRKGKMLAVMFLDLDRFQLINDTLGHNAGDLLLRSVTSRLTTVLRDADTVARMGGDEFTAILSDIRSAQDAAQAARRVLDIFAHPFELGGDELYVSASIGISLYPADGCNSEALIKSADTAMYRAKDQGRNRYEFYTEELNVAALERVTLEAGLRKAVERNEICVHYQPRLDLSTGRVIGSEALVRWDHPDLGLIFPGQFITLAEETGLIVPISERVIRLACENNLRWQHQLGRRLEIAVNISARQFQQGDLIGSIKRTLHGTGMDPTSLNIEITESALMQSPDEAVSILQELKDMGVSVSIDDFGTGYSSLSYLKRFPVDYVKIDQSFVRHITEDPDDAAIATAIIAMAHSLDFRVVAEGVETWEQLEYLQSLECDEMQGYLISKPIPPEAFYEFLRESEKKAQLGAKTTDEERRV